MATFLDGGKIPCLLIENKIDLLDGQNLEDSGFQDFAKNNGFCGCFKTSAKTNLNISESMSFLIKEIIKRLEDMKSKGKEESISRDSIILDAGRHTIDADKKLKKRRKC